MFFYPTALAEPGLHQFGKHRFLKSAESRFPKTAETDFSDFCRNKITIYNYLFCGNHDAAVRAAIIYSLFTCCKAANVDTRAWLEDVLKRLPSENNLDNLLPVHWIQSERQ